jgi:hypothetical protein
MNVKLKTHNLRDIYADYVKKLLKTREDYWSLYSKPQRSHIIYTKAGNSVVEVISYVRFKKIVVEFFLRAQEHIIKGDTLRMTKLGTLGAARVERSFEKKVINFHETSKKPKKENGKPCEIVYYDSPDWCRVRWDKPYYRVTWVEVYEFSPCDSRKGMGGFKDKFRNAIRDNRELQLRYQYIPYVK